MWPWIAWMNEWMVSLSPLHLCSNFKVYFLPHYANYILLIVEKVIVICFHLWERPQKLYTLPIKMWCLFWTNYISLMKMISFCLIASHIYLIQNINPLALMLCAQWSWSSDEFVAKAIKQRIILLTINNYL